MVVNDIKLDFFFFILYLFSKICDAKLITGNTEITHKIGLKNGNNKEIPANTIKKSLSSLNCLEDK